MRDAGDPALAGQYDLATAFECIHDMWNPVATLNAMLRLVGPRGTALVMDERVDDEFCPRRRDPPADVWLQPAAGGHDGAAVGITGTVMRPSTFISYATQAGFKSVDILPVENDFFRFYRLNG